MGALSQTLNQTEQTVLQVEELDSTARTKLDSVISDTRKLEGTVQELLDQVEFMKNSDIRGENHTGCPLRAGVTSVPVGPSSYSSSLSGAAESITKYFLQSQAAGAHANASTVDPGSPVEASSDLRQLAEDKMNQTGEEYLRKHAEHAQRLDDLAGELQTLDLSQISHKVGGPRCPQALVVYDQPLKHRCWSGSYRSVAVHPRVRTLAPPLPVEVWAAWTLKVGPSVEVKDAMVS